jgi:hypothetical protein
MIDIKEIFELHKKYRIFLHYTGYNAEKVDFDLFMNMYKVVKDFIQKEEKWEDRKKVLKNIN